LGETISAKMEKVEFPDGTRLYVDTAYGEQEIELLSKWLWEGRWKRRIESISMWLVPWIALTVLPPIALLVLGFAFRWVLAGFRKTIAACASLSLPISTKPKPVVRIYSDHAGIVASEYS